MGGGSEGSVGFGGGASYVGRVTDGGRGGGSGAGGGGATT